MERKVIFISVNVSTEDESEAARAIDMLSRMVLGLALEGLATALEVDTGFIEEHDHEHEGEL